ncbi:MAG: polyprenol monophosphomannose synthase [Actinomycetota bacterium]
MSNNLVILPTFNEAESISGLVTRILGEIADADILVVDGGSKDGTPESVSEIASRNNRVNLLQEGAKRGLGRAYMSGFDWGLKRRYSKLVEMDADNSHQVNDLKKLLDVADADLVIGCRWIAGGQIENWSRFRAALSRFANRYVELALRLGVNDATSGFRVYKAELLNRIDLKSIKSEGYTFQIEMTRAARSLNAKIREVPIVFKEREFGKSKISSGIVFEAMVRVSYWGLKRIGGGGGI